MNIDWQESDPECPFSTSPDFKLSKAITDHVVANPTISSGELYIWARNQGMPADFITDWMNFYGLRLNTD